MGFRDDAIAAAQAEAAGANRAKQDAIKQRVDALKDREVRTRQRAVEAVSDWIIDKGSDPGAAKIVIVDYYFKKHSGDEIPLYESWHNAALITWKLDEDTFIGSFSFFSEYSRSLDFPKRKESDSFEVWIAIGRKIFLARTKEELGFAYMGEGIKRRHSWERNETGWSPFFTGDGAKLQSSLEQ